MKKRRFGRLNDRDVSEITLESADAAVSILNYGCVIRDWRVDGPAGALPMTLGFPTIEDYVQASRSHGAIVGRIANRTKDATFGLDGKVYELTPNHGKDSRHHIHGGSTGLGKRIWDMEADAQGEAAHLRYVSPDGEEGYPGTVVFDVTYRLEGPRLVCEMRGVPDRPTPINLAQHAYFNLGGGGEVRDHTLWVDATRYTVLDDELIPTGEIRSAEGSHLDFSAPRTIEESDPDRIGIDINYVLREGRDETQPAGWATCPRTGRRIEVRTNQPGLQIFNAAKMVIARPGHDGQSYGPYAGLCFEAQHFPDSLNHPEWPSVIRTPEAPYFQSWVVDILKG